MFAGRAEAFQLGDGGDAAVGCFEVGAEGECVYGGEEDCVGWFGAGGGGWEGEVGGENEEEGRGEVGGEAHCGWLDLMESM